VGARCFTQPPKRRQEEERPVPPSLPRDSQGLAVSMHAVPPNAPAPGEASHALVVLNLPPSVVTVDAPTMTITPQGPETLSIHPSLLRAMLNIQSYPTETNSSNPITLALLRPEPSKSCGSTTPNHADGGWTYVGASCHTQADKNRAKKARKWEHEAARAIQIPPAGSSRTKWDYSKARPTHSHKKGSSKSEHTDSVSEDAGDRTKDPPLGLGTLTMGPAKAETSSTTTGQIIMPVPSLITLSILLDFKMDLDELPGPMHLLAIGEDAPSSA
jgi:hypothetical protein